MKKMEIKGVEAHGGFTRFTLALDGSSLSAGIDPSEPFAFAKINNEEAFLPDALNVARFAAKVKLSHIPGDDTGIFGLETSMDPGVRDGMPFELAIKNGKLTLRHQEYYNGKYFEHEIPELDLAEEFGFEFKVTRCGQSYWFNFDLVSFAGEGYQLMRSWPALNAQSYKDLYFYFGAGLWVDEYFAAEDLSPISIELTNISCHQGGEEEIKALERPLIKSVSESKRKQKRSESAAESAPAVSDDHASDSKSDAQ